VSGFGTTRVDEYVRPSGAYLLVARYTSLTYTRVRSMDVNSLNSFGLENSCEPYGSLRVSNLSTAAERTGGGCCARS